MPLVPPDPHWLPIPVLAEAWTANVSDGAVTAPPMAPAASEDLSQRERLAAHNVRSGGAQAQNERFNWPPPSPGEEARATADATGVVDHCDRLQQELATRGIKVIRKVVSRSARFGVVWRADVVVNGADPLFRTICWRDPGPRGGYGFWMGPLQMFDPSQSIPPLAP